MPTIPPNEQLIIRERPLGRNLFLYLYRPQTIWSATITGGPYEVGARVLETTNPSGNPGGVGEDLTIWVTTASGGSLGRVRCRDLSGTTLTVAENAIPWADGVKVYVKLLYELWPRWPYFDAATETVYKDRDIAWVSDARTQGPKANAGPLSIARLGAGGHVDVYFTGEDSFKVPGGGAVDTYAWQVDGTVAYSVVGGGLAQQTVTLRFTEAGYYYVMLSVTDGAEVGKVRVPVIIDNASGGNALLRFNVDPRRWAECGWTLDMDLVGLAGLVSDGLFYDGGLLALACFEDRQTAPSAFYTDRAATRWTGWLISEDLERDGYTRLGGFAAISTTHMLSRLRAFPTRVEDHASPTSWHTLSNLCLDSAVYHVGKWHSTLMTTCHWQPTGEWQSRPIQVQSFEAGNLLEQFNEVLKACRGAVRSDRQGIARAWRNPWFMSSVEQAALNTVLTLQASDWASLTVGGVEYRPRQSETVMGGYADETPLLAGSPGQSPLEGGGASEEQGLAPINQDELTRWAGQALAVANREITVALNMAGEFDVFDPAIAELVNGDLPGYDWRIPPGPYTIVGAEVTQEPITGVSLGKFILMPDPGAYPSQARDIPPIPAPPPSDPIDWYPEPIEPPFVEPWPSKIFVGTFEKGVYYTETFDGPGTAQPTWTAINNGLTDLRIKQLALDPFNKTGRQYCITGSRIYTLTCELHRREGSGNWTSILTQAQIESITGETNMTVSWIAVDPEVDGRLWVLGHVEDMAPSSWGAVVLESNDYGTTWPVWRGVRTGYVRESRGIKVDNNELYTAFSIGTFADQLVYYSANKGVSWIASAGLGATRWPNFLAYNILLPSHIYIRKRDVVDPTSFDLAKIACPSMLVTVLQDSLDLWTEPYPTVLWFSLAAVGYNRFLSSPTGGSTQLFVSQDGWTTVNDNNPLPINVTLDLVCERVNPSDEDMILLGAFRGVGISQPHIIFAMYGELITNPEGRAGTSPHTSPYTNSIPRDCGGVCYEGIQVAG